MVNELETKGNKIQAKDKVEPRHDSNLCTCCRKKHANPVLQNKAFRKLVLMFRETSRRQVML